MAESRYFPDLSNGFSVADVNQVEDAFSLVESDMGTKVDKVSGKGLSTNDFTNDDKDRLNKAVVYSEAIAVTDFNSREYTYHGQYAVSFTGNAIGVPSGLDADTTYYGTLITENYDSTDGANVNYGVYQKLTIPILNRVYERYVYDGAERYGDWVSVTEMLKPLAVDNWKAVQEIVRSGMARQVFNIGDQLVCQKNGQDLVWDIIGIDHDTPTDSQYTHSMTLQLHDCVRPGTLNTGTSGREALFYAENELPAGTYNFTLTPGVDTSAGGGKTYSFTLTKAVPAGGQIFFGWDSQQASVALVLTYSSYSSTVAIESVGVTEGASGTALSDIGECNNTYYIRYGSNNYVTSAARQWLNTDGEANQWWQPATNFQRSVVRLTDSPGFLRGIDSDFLEVLGEVNKKVILSDVVEGGVVGEFSDKFFLLANSEIYLKAESVEGTAYEFYKKYSGTDTPTSTANGIRQKYLDDNPIEWWVRSCNTFSGSLVGSVLPTGAASAHHASHGYGTFAPACCIV